MLGVLAILHRELSDPAEMLRWIERELAAGRLNRARNHFIFWRAVEALQWLELGEISRASQILEQDGGRDFWSDSYQARLLFRLGDWQAATAFEERALEVSRGHGDRWNWTFHARSLATMNRTLGDFGRAEQLGRCCPVPKTGVGWAAAWYSPMRDQCSRGIERSCSGPL
jgi:hypothetical protein